MQGESLGQYVAQKYPGQKVAVLYQNDPLGQGYLTGFKKYDNNIATAQPYASTDVDFSSQLNAMKASGAPLAACFCLSTQIAQVLKFRESSRLERPGDHRVEQRRRRASSAPSARPRPRT